MVLQSKFLTFLRKCSLSLYLLYNLSVQFFSALAMFMDGILWLLKYRMWHLSCVKRVGNAAVSNLIICSIYIHMYVVYDNINKFMSSYKYVMYIHTVGIICTVLVRRQKPTRNQQQTQRPHVDNKCL